MSAGRQTDMKRGAIWACVIPVGLGVIATILMVMSLIPLAFRGVAVWDDAIAIAPIIGCFIFGAPMAAWIACRSLAKIESAEKLSQWRSSAVRELWGASLMHLLWGSLYTLGFAVLALNEVRGVFLETGQNFSTILGLFIGSVFINIIAWVIITLPLSLLCATIFWRVTKFPSGTDVFE